MAQEDIPVLPSGWRGTTYRNSKIRSYNDLRNRVFGKLGTGASSKISDFSFSTIVDDALERFSRYAGYDKEYIVLCDTALDSGCGVELDDLVNSCLCDEVASSTGDLLETTYISSTDIEKTLIASTESLLSSFTYLSSNGAEALNEQVTTELNGLELYFNPDNPWDFDNCRTNLVVLSQPEPIPDIELLSPCLDVSLSASNGLACFFPTDYESGDPCGPLSSWWGIDDYLSSFDPLGATHVIVKGVPSCTVGGVNAISLNTGRAGQFKISNKSLDTCGEIPVQIQFIKDYSLPPSLSGEFNVAQNTGFKLKLDTTDIENFVCTPELLDVQVDFYSCLSSVNYGVSSTPLDQFTDYDTLCKRKVAGVFDVSGGSALGANHKLFSFQHGVMQQSFGFDGVGGRMAQTGYDLVSYELAMQYINQVQKLFGGGSYVGFDFNPRTQRLKIHRSSNQAYVSNCNNGCYLLGIYLERPLEDMINETWVIDFVEAQTKITIGNTLAQYQGVTTLGGITVTGTDLLSQGLTERDLLLTKLTETNSEGSWDVPLLIC